MHGLHKRRAGRLSKRTGSAKRRAAVQNRATIAGRRTLIPRLFSMLRANRPAYAYGPGALVRFRTPASEVHSCPRSLHQSLRRPPLIALLQPGFLRRPNNDGTSDLICRQCFVTVCTSHWESDLDRAEKTHVCDPHLLDRWRSHACGEPAQGQKKSPGREKPDAAKPATDPKLPRTGTGRSA